MSSKYSFILTNKLSFDLFQFENDYKLNRLYFTYLIELFNDNKQTSEFKDQLVKHLYLCIKVSSIKRDRFLQILNENSLKNNNWNDLLSRLKMEYLKETDDFNYNDLMDYD